MLRGGVRAGVGRGVGGGGGAPRPGACLRAAGGGPAGGAGHHPQAIKATEDQISPAWGARLRAGSVCAIWMRRSGDQAAALDAAKAIADTALRIPSFFPAGTRP